jgi:hypothetical protein
MRSSKEFKPIINTGKQLEYEVMLKGLHFDTTMWVTFRQECSVSTAKHQLSRFFKHLNDGEVDFYKRVIYAWAFYEKNDDNGVHVHLLVKGLDPDHYQLLEETLLKTFGHAEVKACHDNSVPYVAQKYGTTKLVYDEPMRINSHRRQRQIQMVGAN